MAQDGMNGREEEEKKKEEVVLQFRQQVQKKAAEPNATYETITQFVPLRLKKPHQQLF